jgi:hypothetical protein
MIPDLLLVLLHHQGRDHAISADELLTAMRHRGHDIPGLPALRGLIHDARQQRHVICSGDEGYFLPTTLSEAINSINERLRDPAGDQMRTARILRQAAREQFGRQLQLM